MRLRLLDRVRRSLVRRTARLKKARAAESRGRASRAAGRRARPRGGAGDTPGRARHQVAREAFRPRWPEGAGHRRRHAGRPGQQRARGDGPAPGPAGQVPGAAARAPGTVGRVPGTIGSHRRGAAPRLVLPDSNSTARASELAAAGRPAGEPARPGGSAARRAPPVLRPRGPGRPGPGPRRAGGARPGPRYAPQPTRSRRASRAPARRPWNTR